MIIVNDQKCNGCGLCVDSCPLAALQPAEGLVTVNEDCVQCLTCLKFCNREALSGGEVPEDTVMCTSCGVRCRIPLGKYGACKRYNNEEGRLVRNRDLYIPRHEPLSRKEAILQRPLITAVGAGTSYPDYKPAPYILRNDIDGVDVVTAVTEAHVSYSSMQVKIDTNQHIGKEGSAVKSRGKRIGVVSTEQYGSHILILGGVNTVKGRHGQAAVRTIVDLGNGDRVSLQIENGSTLELQVGGVPVIDGQEDPKMRVGCGGANIGLFASHFAEVVDEVIVLDHHIIGLHTGHPAGAELSPPSGITPVGRMSTPGRYFGESGSGWGGTSVTEPLAAIKDIDRSVAWPGMKILVAETTWRKVALFVLSADYLPQEVPLSPEIENMVAMIAGNCENARVSALYYAGVGGSARAGITKNPIKLTEAVHRGEAHLTIGGAQAFVFPGGGITFLADVERMAPRPFSMIPTPAVVAPVEYTMEYKVYERIGGHIHAVVRSLDEK